MSDKLNNKDKVERSSLMIKAIAHPTRIQILSMLKDGNEHNVTEIYLKLSCEQSTISHHLVIMKDKDVLKSRRDGKNTFYSVKRDAFVDCINKTFLQEIQNLAN